VSLVSGASKLWWVIDGVASANVTTATVPVNSNPITFTNNNTMLYADNITEYVAGVQKLWFQPNDIVHEITSANATLIDRMGTQNGVITWGTNSVDLTMGSLGSFTPTTSPSLAVTTTPTNPDVLPTMNPNGSTMPSTPTNPLSPLVTVWAFLWMVNTSAMWFFLAIICIIGTYVGMIKLFQHAGYAGIAAGLVAGVFSVIGVMPMGFIFIDVIIIVACVVIEVRA
jgi:hypothetical protein